MKYILTGGAGNISRPLALRLMKAGHQVVVIGRDENRLKEMVQAGAQISTGSLQDNKFLERAFAGADAVYTMFPPNYATNDIKAFYEMVGKNYSKAIHANRIKYVVNLSSIGAHLSEGGGPASGLHRAEEALNSLMDVNIKHLRPAYFYHNLTVNIHMIKSMGIIGSNFSISGKRFPLSDHSDIVAVAAEELLALNFSGHSIRYIASDESDTEEIAAVLGRAIGKPELKWIKFSDDQALEGMLNNGMSKEIADDFVEMGNAINSGKMLEDYWKHRPAKSGAIKLEDFATVFASSYGVN